MLRIARIFSLGVLALGVGACDRPDDDLSLRWGPADTYPDEHDPDPDPDLDPDPDPDPDPDCPEEPPHVPPKDVCGYRTQTQGGWGTSCNGNNPGCFRDHNFDKAFPKGLTIGCGDRTAVFKNSLAVERALPTGGPPSVLDHAKVGVYDGSDPVQFKNVLVGQLVAASLSVGFSKLSSFVKQDTTPFAKLVLAKGKCAGMSVKEVLKAANDALGGCYSTLSPGEANTCLTQINESFVDGKIECSTVFKQPPFDPGRHLSLGCY